MASSNSIDFTHDLIIAHNTWLLQFALTVKSHGEAA